MKKVSIFLLSVVVTLLMSFSLNAQTLKYKIYSPVTGKLGKITLKRAENGKSYEMVGEVISSGIAKGLTGKRKDKYVSVGTIKGGRYVTHKFVIERKDKKRQEIVEYTFDYKAKKVLKHRKRWKNGKLDKDKVESLGYFTDTDIAALFHNMLIDMKSPGQKDYIAVGAEKIKGRVTVEIPTDAVAKKEREFLKVPNDMRIVHLISKEEIDGKKNRKVIFAVDKNGVIQKRLF